MRSPCGPAGRRPGSARRARCAPVTAARPSWSWRPPRRATVILPAAPRGLTPAAAIRADREPRGEHGGDRDGGRCQRYRDARGRGQARPTRRTAPRPSARPAGQRYADATATPARLSACHSTTLSTWRHTRPSVWGVARSRRPRRTAAAARGGVPTGQGQDPAEDEGGVPDPGVVADVVAALFAGHDTGAGGHPARVVVAASRPAAARRSVPGRWRSNAKLSRPGPGAASPRSGFDSTGADRTAPLPRSVDSKPPG